MSIFSLRLLLLLLLVFAVAVDDDELYLFLCGYLPHAMNEHLSKKRVNRKRKTHFSPGRKCYARSETGFSGKVVKAEGSENRDGRTGESTHKPNQEI